MAPKSEIPKTVETKVTRKSTEKRNSNLYALDNSNKLKGTGDGATGTRDLFEYLKGWTKEEYAALQSWGRTAEKIASVSSQADYIPRRIANWVKEYAELENLVPDPERIRQELRERQKELSKTQEALITTQETHDSIPYRLEDMVIRRDVDQNLLNKINRWGKELPTAQEIPPQGLDIMGRVGYLEGKRSDLEGRLEVLQKERENITGVIENLPSLTSSTINDSAELRSKIEKLDPTVSEGLLLDLEIQDKIWEQSNQFWKDFVAYREGIDTSIEMIKKTLGAITKYGEQGRAVAEDLLTRTHSSSSERGGFVETLRSYRDLIIESLENNFLE